MGIIILTPEDADVVYHIAINSADVEWLYEHTIPRQVLGCSLQPFLKESMFQPEEILGSGQLRKKNKHDGVQLLNSLSRKAVK